MNTSSRGNRIDVADVSGALEKLIDQFDASRSAGLEDLVRVRAAKFNGLARDRDRLANQLGAEDPRVVALDRSLALHSDTLAGFRSEIAVSSIDPPRVGERGWAIHGDVFNTARSPISGLTVALYLKDTWIEALGYACTNADGYFVITVADTAEHDNDTLSLRLLRSEDIVFTDSRPVVVHAGHVEYREIVIDEETGTCQPPTKTTEPPPPTESTGSKRPTTPRKTRTTTAAAEEKPRVRGRRTPGKK